MSLEIEMPALSPTMLHGSLIRWCISEGTSVERGEILAEIETDKSVLEIECPATGILARQLYQAGTEDIPVGSVIAVLCDNESEIASLNLSNSELVTHNKACTLNEHKVDQTKSSVNNGAARLLASPLAKHLAKKNNIELASLKGSGPNGRIIKQDVENFIASNGRGNITDKKNTVASGGNFKDIKLSSVRKSIARRLQESKQNIPHFYLSIDIELDNLLSMREELNESNSANKISINDFIIKASALSLQECPTVNAHFLNDSIRQFENIDIAIATAIDNSLVTPILRNADKLTLKNISLTVKDLVAKAKSSKLLPEDYQGGTFTISNLGMYKVNQFDAIINPPQVAILAVGIAGKRPIIKDEAIVPATIMTLTLSCDHRVIDGKNGTKLLSTIKRYLENPVTTLA